MTFATRHTLAYFQSSSIVARRWRQKSRRASSATSRPILFRYLKQSATVFAALYTRTGTPSILCFSTPLVRAAPENLTILSGGWSTVGFHAFVSSASHTWYGACVVSP